MTTPARRLAYECLQRIDHHGAYANLVVPAALSDSDLSGRDRGLVTDIVYGTTRMRRACDALVDPFVRKAPRPHLRTLLRMGAYQLHFTHGATHAVINETVGLAAKAERGFVNAVLRKVSTATVDEAGTLGERLSYPDWIVDTLTTELGDDDAVAAMTAMNEPATVHRRDDGYVQDPGSQWVVEAVPAAAGERVLDVCAAPGGKATGIAADGAWVVAAEIHAGRAGLIAANVERLRSDVAVVVADGTFPPFAAASFDHVLLDAPCSGLGSLRRRPDARWRVTPNDVVELATLQQRLLHSSAAVVRPGGTLTYSVCTLTAAESTDHALPDGFTVDSSPPLGPWAPFHHGWRLLPTAEHDGMILIRLRRDGAVE